MSRDTPEVGDVWGNAFTRYYIEAVDLLGEKNQKTIGGKLSLNFIKKVKLPLK